MSKLWTQTLAYFLSNNCSIVMLTFSWSGCCVSFI